MTLKKILATQPKFDNIYINDKEASKLIGANTLNKQVYSFIVKTENNQRILYVYTKGYYIGKNIKYYHFDEGEINDK